MLKSIARAALGAVGLRLSRTPANLPATTLDALLADRVGAADRVLLKLDLEGYELEALRGAARLLDAVEVIASEVQFYPLDDNGRACFLDLALALRERGFELHD